MIGGRNIHLELMEVDVESGFDFLRISSCLDPSCNASLPLASFTGSDGVNRTFFLPAGAFRVSLLSDFGISGFYLLSYLPLPPLLCPLPPHSFQLPSHL